MDKVHLLGATRTRIVKHLAQEARTATQVATALGIQVSAARKHLERLRTMGVVDAHFERTGPGRPKKFYALAEEGRELFPRRYDEVLNAVLAGLVRDESEAPVRRALHRVATDLSKTAGLEPGTDRPHLRRLVAGLEGLGFDPRLSEGDGRCTITSHNCPILRTAKVHRELVCDGLHAEILRVGTGGSEVHRGKWIVDGDPVCTHVVRLA